MTQRAVSTSKQVVNTIKQQFYRRKLPETCISFSSEDGKKIFKEALSSGHMDCYFKLAAQFRTQDEPAFCGLSTLVMVLNALEVDPERVWKGPWRWYHENMLDCCVPVKVVEQEGITFEQFICLAECNGLETMSGLADEKASEESFRDMLIKYTRQDESLITLSYSRKVLNQTGDGHFSPVGGYHPDRDLVLMMDTARFKYPPHWVPVPLMFKAMQALDKSTGKPRGYAVVTKQPRSQILLLFRISESFGVTLKNHCCQNIGDLLSGWKLWLSQSSTEGIEEVTKNAVRWLVQASREVPPDQFIFTTQVDIRCPRDISEQHACAVHSLIEELLNNEIFKIVNDFLSGGHTDENLAMFGVPSTIAPTCCPDRTERVQCLQSLAPSHFIALFLLCWPYQTDKLNSQTNAFILNKQVCVAMSGDAKYLGSEVRQLRKQLTVLKGSEDKCSECVKCLKKECA